MEKNNTFSQKGFRETLEELFAYIPYFEERVNGTFKFQYYDGEKDRIVDYDGYEEKNRAAQFSDPMYDETYSKFKYTFLEKIGFELKPASRPPFHKFLESGKFTPQELFADILFQLKYDTIHERMYTGHTAWCMKNGIFLRELKLLQILLNEMSDLERNDTSETDLQSLSPDERKRVQFNRQKDLFDRFLSHGAIDRSQYEDCLFDIAGKMGVELNRDTFTIE